MEFCCMFVVLFARYDACVKNSSKYTSQKSESYSVQDLKNNLKKKKRERKTFSTRHFQCTQLILSQL